MEPVLHVVLGAAGQIAADLRPAVAQEVVQRAEEKVLGLRPAGFGETGNELVEPTLAALGERGRRGKYLLTSTARNVLGDDFPLLFSVLGN